MSLGYIDFHRRLSSNLADFHQAANAVRNAMVCVLDPQGQLVTMNAAGLRHFGLPLDVIAHMDRGLLVHPDDRVTLEVSRWYLMTHRRCVTGLYRVWCADQCYRRMLCDAVPVLDPGDRGIAYLAVGSPYEGARRPNPSHHRELFLRLLGLDGRVVLASRRSVPRKRLLIVEGGRSNEPRRVGVSRPRSTLRFTPQ